MKYFNLLFFGLLAHQANAEQVKSKTNIIYFNPIQSMVASDQVDVTTMAFGYEKFHSGIKLAFNTPVFLGFEKEDGNVSYSFGGGIILKKYLLNHMKGGYPFALFQGVQGKSDADRYYNGIYQNVGVYKRLYEVGVGYGYLWKWNQAILDWNLGAKMEFIDSDANLKLLGNINLGFPF